MRKHSIVVGGLALAGLTACVGDRLQVNNLNNPDVARAFATPQGVEGVIAGLGAQLFNPQRASESVNTQAKILAGENFATVNNFGMAPRSIIPQGPIDNSIGNNVQTGNLANFNSFQRVARSANNAIRALNTIVDGGGTLGSPAQNARAKSFAFLILGQALGYASFAYDSASIVTPTIPSDSVPGLSHYSAVNAAAVAMLDSALAVANSANATNGGNGWPLPTNWINGTTPTRDQYIRIVRSYRARIRAGGARTPAERAALPWNLIIDDAMNGITADFNVIVNSSLGWTAGYDTQQMYVEGGWHQAPIWYTGMADTSGSYDAWLATPRTSREGAIIRTPDRRWPPGDTRAQQVADASSIVLPAGRYLRNRPPADDVVGTEWGFSMYDHRRYGATRVAGNIGPYTEISATETSMLAAEGYIRTNQIALAIPLINASRTRNGLAPIPAGTSATQPIGTMPNCVPRVPQAPNFTSTSCGTVLEAMKYEKRMETQFTGYMIWFTDSRGWGDLPQGTPLDWPVPYQELQSRRAPIYNGDPARVAGLGTYGFR